VPRRLSSLESSCPSMAPWPQTLTLLLCPSAKFEGIGLAGVAPPISPAGPQARWLPSLKAPLEPFFLLALLPP
jgi:hypothetical protein